jgi:hypoxanthine-DNA glycosylase
MLGVKSVNEQEYYAHPQNAFREIIRCLYNPPNFLGYQQKKSLLLAKHIALWDVLKFCERQGSLDANIKKETMQINDFVSLFADYPKVTHVFLMEQWQRVVIKRRYFLCLRVFILRLLILNYPQRVLLMLQ